MMPVCLRVQSGARAARMLAGRRGCRVAALQFFPFHYWLSFPQMVVQAGVPGTKFRTTLAPSSGCD